MLSRDPRPGGQTERATLRLGPQNTAVQDWQPAGSKSSADTQRRWGCLWSTRGHAGWLGLECPHACGREGSCDLCGAACGEGGRHEDCSQMVWLSAWQHGPRRRREDGPHCNRLHPQWIACSFLRVLSLRGSLLVGLPLRLVHRQAPHTLTAAPSEDEPHVHGSQRVLPDPQEQLARCQQRPRSARPAVRRSREVSHARSQRMPTTWPLAGPAGASSGTSDTAAGSWRASRRPEWPFLAARYTFKVGLPGRETAAHSLQSDQGGAATASAPWVRSGLQKQCGPTLAQPEES